jgi:predicted amidohydrolase
MRVAVVQMTSTDEIGINLAAAEKWIAQAADQGAELIALPENFAYLRREGTGVPCAQSLEGEIVGALRAWAGRHRIWLVGVHSFRAESLTTQRRDLAARRSSPSPQDPPLRRRPLGAELVYESDASRGIGGVLRNTGGRRGSRSATTCASSFAASRCVRALLPLHSHERRVATTEVLLRARAVEPILRPRTAQCGEHRGRLNSRSMVVDP